MKVINHLTIEYVGQCVYNEEMLMCHAFDEKKPRR